MKKTILILCILFATIGIFAQSPYSSRLTFYGANISVSPSEQIWVTTKSGYLLHTTGIGNMWHFGSFGDKSNYPYDGKGTFERLTAFNNDTLIISGYIHGDNSETDFVWWTGNRGKSWQKIRFGASSWTDAFYHLPNGKAWMSGSSQYIYYTKDFGKTWKQFDKVEQTGNLRFQTICFDKDETTGLFGSTWNVIYKTTDNCLTWEKLPTPYSQGKYKWKYTGGNVRPEINKIRIVGDYYIVSQHNRVFVSPKDSVDWIPMPTVKDFEMTAAGNIYLIHKDRTVELLDSSLKTLWKSADILPENVMSLTVQNETLFFLTRNSVGKLSPESFLISEALTDDKPIAEPYLKITFRGEQYGFEGEEILQYDKTELRWKRFLSADFFIGSCTVYQGKLIITDSDERKHFALDAERRQLQPFTIPDRLFASTTPVKDIKFELGSSGCFHNEVYSCRYVRDGNGFKRDRKGDTLGKKIKLPVHLDADVVESLVLAADSLKNHRLTISDLNITPMDILRYQQFIDEESTKTGYRGYATDPEAAIDYTFDDNTDYSFYRDISPLLNSVTEEVMERIFYPENKAWSTTTNWRKVTIGLGNDMSLEILNEDYQPEYAYFPWAVRYNGLVFKVNSFEVGRIINELTGQRFLNQQYYDKNYLLYCIADYFFWKRMGEE